MKRTEFKNKKIKIRAPLKRCFFNYSNNFSKRVNVAQYDHYSSKTMKLYNPHQKQL